MRLVQVVFCLVCLTAVPLLFSSLSVFFSYLYSTSDSAPPTESGEKSGFRSWFSFPTPSALFPPSAIIGLTDDNSTFFLARPAAFGPPLPRSGLSGPLWIGSGFGDDNARRQAGLGTNAEGELGCSDQDRQGLVSESIESSRKSVHGGLRGGPSTSEVDGLRGQQAEHASGDERGSASMALGRIVPPHDDGTDDYLHDSLRVHQNRPSQHADIQSLQEGAEIAGKVVLLSRGGCSFLDKAMWVQRRGGLALIVGDYRKGGPLITMYPNRDARNVSIPSLFTSHMTAHLLSSLVPPEGSSSESASSGSIKPTTKDPRSGAHREQKTKIRVGNDLPTFTPMAPKPKATSAGRSGNRASSTKRLNFASGDPDITAHNHFGWIRKILSWLGLRDSKDTFAGLEADSRRPPSSGQLDWVLVDDVTGKDDSSAAKPVSTSAPQSNSKSTAAGATPNRAASRSADIGSQADDFIIGVQDWRDKDLLGPNSSKQSDASSEQRSHDSKMRSERARDRKLAAPQKDDPPASDFAKTATTGKKQDGGSFQGGVITPGSGEYSNPGKKSSDSSSHAKDTGVSIAGPREPSTGQVSSEGWFGHIPWSRGEAKGSSRQGPEDRDKPGGERTEKWNNRQDESSTSEGEDEVEHEGLWVTLTPTTMSTSPFFDTLLVLVVSPLVTLTVVYGMLLVRSRIRRRRWRAPKAVVDRLPVRTYHTLSSSSSSSLESLRYSTPSSTSPACPLLCSESISAGPRGSRQRPASNIHYDAGVARSWPPGAHESPITPGTEKTATATGNRDCRYVWKQVECVICLEEYVDGVSRVMSLPCGHEFHAECM